MQHLSAAEWADFNPSDQPTVMTFTQPGCAPCRQLKRVLEAVESKNPNLRFASVDIQQVPDAIDEYMLAGTPTTYLFIGNEPKSFRGVKSVAELSELLAS